MDATSTDRSHYSCGNRISVVKNDPYSFTAPRATRNNSLPTCFSHIKNDTIQDSFALPLWDYGQPTARVKATSLISGVNIYVCNIYAHCYNHLSVLSFSLFSLPSRLLVFLLVIITYLMSFSPALQELFSPCTSLILFPTVNRDLSAYSNRIYPSWMSSSEAILDFSLTHTGCY